MPTTSGPGYDGSGAVGFGASLEVTTADEIAAQPGDDAKSNQRRKLACAVCRRMKTRCDYDSVSGACRRCTNLRIECSLSLHESRDHIPRSSSGVAAQQDDGPSITLEDLRSSIEDLKIEVRNHLAGARSRSEEVQRELSTPRGLPGSPFDSNGPPADEPSKSAPLSVVREVSDSLHWPSRRDFVDKSVDVVASGLLLEHQAVQLASAFCHQHQNLLHIYGKRPSIMAMEIRKASPFLFSVCCLHGIRLCPGLVLSGTSQHESLFNHAQNLLCRVLIQSPLPVDSIYAILIASMFNAPPKMPFEYIDSWLLSGNCAQQAMLKMNFSKIAKSIATFSLDAEDLRLLRLWNAICVNHLRFAAGCGRPSVISPTYLDQASILFNTPYATSDDALGTAELMLYCCLNKIMERQIGVEDDGRCPALETWKGRWSHLLDIPHRSMLRLSYHFVYVIAIKRTIELLKDEAKSSNSTDCGETSSPLEQSLIQNVSHHAKLALEHSLHVPASLVTGLAVFEYMNLAYSALTLLEYMSRPDGFMVETADLLERVRAYYDDPAGNVRSVLWFASKKAKEACQVSEKDQNNEQEISMANMLDEAPTAVFKGYTSLDDLNLRFPNFGILFGDMDTDPITLD